MSAKVKIVSMQSSKARNTASVSVLVSYNGTDALVPLPLPKRPTTPTEWASSTQAALHGFLAAARSAPIEGAPSPNEAGRSRTEMPTRLPRQEPEMHDFRDM